MVFPPGDTPLYNHSLPVIEKWLKSLGCQQDTNNLNRWEVERFNWKGEIYLEIEDITVRYLIEGEGRSSVTSNIPSVVKISKLLFLNVRDMLKTASVSPEA